MGRPGRISHALFTKPWVVVLFVFSLRMGEEKDFTLHIIRTLPSGEYWSIRHRLLITAVKKKAEEQLCISLSSEKTTGKTSQGELKEAGEKPALTECLTCAR